MEARNLDENLQASQGKIRTLDEHRRIILWGSHHPGHGISCPVYARDIRGSGVNTKRGVQPLFLADQHSGGPALKEMVSP